MSELSLIGLSHRTAQVAVRERVALPGPLAGRVLRSLHRDAAFEEALVLDTCNRTELYFVARPGGDPLGRFLEHVSRTKDVPPPEDRSVFYRRDGLEAVRHLFRVASSLDSQIVGEHQILGQVREAYREALDARTSGFFLNKLLHWAFRAGKRVLSETELGRGTVSVAQVAVDLAGQVFESLEGRSVLVVGAGQTAEAAARALGRAGIGRLTVVNRTRERAETLLRAIVEGRPADPEACATEVGGEDVPVTCPALLGRDDEQAAAEEAVVAAPLMVTAEALAFDRLAESVAAADLVIASTGATEPVLTHDALAPRLSRRSRPLVIIDIAVPRDAEPALGNFDSVFLYNMDDLDRLVERNLERRRQEIPRAEAVVEDEVAAFDRWLASRQVTPTIRLLQRRFEMLRSDEIAEHARQFGASDHGQLSEFTRHLCSRILHGPMVHLKAAAEESALSDMLATVETVRRMFDLDALDATEADEPREDEA